MKIKYSLATLSALAATSLAANAVTLLTETFGTTAQNPMDSPSTTTDAVWTYGGPGGANSSRLFNPGGVGAGTNSHGWISNVDGSSITTQIVLTGAGSEIADSSTYTLRFMVAAETGDATRFATGDINVTSSTGVVNFVTGSNGDNSQVLTGFDDDYQANGGSVGASTERVFTYTFTTTGVTSADTLDLTFTRSGGTAFYYVDDVNLEVTAVPEPSSAALLGLGGLALVLRRRK